MQENNNLLIVGAGEYGKLVKEIVVETNFYNKIEFIDDVASNVLGKVSDLQKYVGEFRFATVAIGNSVVRMALIDKLKHFGYEIATVLHPKSYISNSAKIGKGCLIEPFAVVQTGAEICDGCLISAGAIVGHNAIVNEGCHIDIGAVVPQRSVVIKNTKVSARPVYCGENENNV